MTAVEAKKWCVVHRNRNLRTSKALLKSQAHQGTSLFTSAATNQRGFPKGVKRSSGPNSRVPGGDRVAVRVGVVEMGRGNESRTQGRYRSTRGCKTESWYPTGSSLWRNERAIDLDCLQGRFQLQTQSSWKSLSV